MTDDALAFKAGETVFSSPWSQRAKKFRVDKRAIYLYGKNLPFEAQCIPDWRGHGVDKKELVATLKKAGLKKVMSGRLKFFIGFVATPVVLASLLTIYFYIGGIEWESREVPDVVAMWLEAHKVPDEENAYLALVALTNLYHVAENDDDTAEISDATFVSDYGGTLADADSATMMTVRNDPSSLEHAEKIISDNNMFFDEFHKALSCEGFYNKEWDDWICEVQKGRIELSPYYEPPIPNYMPILRFGQLLAMKAQVAIEREDINTAVSAIDDIHDLGRKISTNACSLIDYLVGTTIEKYSYQKMCDVATLSRGTDEILKKYDNVLDEDDVNATGCFVRAGRAYIAQTYINFIMLLGNDMTYGNREKLFGHSLRWPGYFGFSIHQRKTMCRMAEIVRAGIANESLPEHYFEWMDEPNWVGNLNFVQRLVPNWQGSRGVVTMLPFLKPCFNDNNLNRIRPRLVLASEKWRRAHGGENPPSLDALVPDYLAAVPRDPWIKSGEPVKYDASLGVAWSVGKDGKYDYREIAKDIPAAGNKASINGDTQKYAFRLDGKPIGFSSTAGRK